MTLTHDNGSVLQFTPDASMRWIVDINKSGKNSRDGTRPTAAVIGWAVVVTDTDFNYEEPIVMKMETQVQPVVLGWDSRPQSENEFSAYSDGSCLFELRHVESEEWQRVANDSTGW
jgi:hypothetical protein